jgi:thiamine-monophosphate kinase
MLNEILENGSIEILVQHFSRSPLQKNSLHESDAELIRLPGTGISLAITLDSIVEEIEVGLYKNPYLIGWMTVMVNASDLAAVGAEPIGILINETFLSNTDENFKHRLQQGIADACSECKMHVLGGDTNFSSRMEMTGCAFGYIPDDISLTRIGCKPGELLFVSGRPGLGNAFALNELKNGSLPKSHSLNFQPKSRLMEGKILRHFATCCMDTSDGLFATLDQLMRLNDFGFCLDLEIKDLLHADSLSVCESNQIPPWLMLAGHHGEFELAFTIKSDEYNDFINSANQCNWDPIFIGYVIKEPDVQIIYNDETVSLNTGHIRNLFVETAGEIDEYIRRLMNLESTF